MCWGKKCAGLVPQTVAAKSANASCEIIQLFWNFGSGLYVLVCSSSSVINAGCCGVPIWPNWNGVVFSKLFVVKVREPLNV